MMELTFQHNIEELPAMLAFNYDELKAGLQNYLSRFEGLVVTEDMIKSAEADRAAINKTRDAIKRARIDIKKRAFDAFEQKAKELRQGERGNRRAVAPVRAEATGREAESRRRDCGGGDKPHLRRRCSDGAVRLLADILQRELESSEGCMEEQRHFARQHPE